MSTTFSIPKDQQQKIDYQKLIIQSFGLGALKTQLYNIPTDKQTELKRDYNVPASPTKDDPIAISPVLNTPVFSNIVFMGRDYTDIYGNTQSYPSLEIQTVLFGVTQTKNVIKTAINGLDGTVKEYISQGDYVVNMQGVLVGGNGIYPRQDMNALIQICKASEPIEVESWFLQSLGIFQIVIESYDFPQEAGKYSVQSFSINAVSDRPIELILSV